MARKVVVLKEECIECGACMDICPEVFEEDEKGKSQVKEGADLSLDCVLEAAEECPVEAIEVEG